MTREKKDILKQITTLKTYVFSVLVSARWINNIFIGLTKLELIIKCGVPQLDFRT